MTRKILFFGILIIAQTFNACRPRSFDPDIELGADLYIIDHGSGFKFIQSHNDNTKNIYGTVLDYSYNSDFIVVEQKPSRKFHEIAMAWHLNDGINSYEFLISRADSIMDNDPYYKKIFSSPVNYWIVVTKDQFVIGPLNSQEYQVKYKELGIPSEVNLKSIPINYKMAAAHD